MVLLGASCAAEAPPAERPRPPAGIAAPPAEAPPAAAISPEDAGPGNAPETSEEPVVPPEDVLFDDRRERSAAARECAGADDVARTHCLLDARYRGDGQAAALARELFDRWGVLPGVEPEHDMDGGYRGLLHLVPVVPTGAERRHLSWVRAAMDDYRTFFEKLGEGRGETIRYRHERIAFRFFRSVRAHTPAAYASSWTVAYNVQGSLNVSAASVRETLFHEIFHLNDQEHGDWSPTALGAIYDSVVARCGTKMSCLRPFAPGDTVVRGGIYYAFQPGNGVREYAAELAIRYYREQRAQLGMEAKRQPAFKCGAEENARAWKALADEFFGGIDRTPGCT